MTPRTIIDKHGPEVIAAKLGVTLGHAKDMRSEDRFPASWYVVIRKLEPKAPLRLFAFKGGKDD